MKNKYLIESDGYTYTVRSLKDVKSNYYGWYYSTLENYGMCGSRYFTARDAKTGKIIIDDYSA